MAVVGAGPAGLFTTDELLRHPEVSAVDIYDRVPTPYGLVRAGALAWCDGRAIDARAGANRCAFGRVRLG